jgi:transcriptional regulator with XRE-family HTH domain
VRVPVDGDALRRELARRGMNQAEFSRLANLSEATVSHAACGLSVSIQTVRKLAVAIVRTPVMPGADALLAAGRGGLSS